MIRDIITPSTTRDQWACIRAGIHERILQSMGQGPHLGKASGFECLSEHSHDGLRIQEFQFQPLPRLATFGSIVHPPLDRALGAGILCIHGTDHKLAHRNVLSPREKPNRQYAIELAQQGFTTLAVDQFGFGEGNAGHSQEEIITAFYKQYPEWSLDGVRLSIHQRAIDLFHQHTDVDVTRVGCIGNSLGGRAAIYLAALDERIRSCVVSTGVSPNITNVFRNQPCPLSLSPELAEKIRQTGVPPFEYQEMLSLIAPRAVLMLEPWNDTYNPLVEPIFRCFEKARFVFQLCGSPANLQILCHGDGHDTIPDIRNYAYAWLLRTLGAGAEGDSQQETEGDTVTRAP